MLPSIAVSKEVFTSFADDSIKLGREGPPLWNSVDRETVVIDWGADFVAQGSGSFRGSEGFCSEGGVELDGGAGATRLASRSLNPS